MRKIQLNSHTKLLLGIGMGLILLAALLLLRQTAVAQTDTTPAPSPLHPPVTLLDDEGTNVQESGRPISTMQTCGQCHDSEFIAGHSFHADAGLSQFGQPGTVDWASSPGLFGNWDPITYRSLSPAGDDVIDLTTPEWLMTLGLRHVGGGPAVTGRDGTPLVELTATASNPETSLVAAQTGDTAVWDWAESGTVEMNCFLCHTADPDNDARTASLRAGAFGWANTATLAGTDLVAAGMDGWQYNPAAFAADGTVLPEYLTVQDPTNENCGSCHGTVHTDLQTALTLADPGWSTLTTGQIMSGQKLLNSGLNLADKESLNRSWDIHTERVLACTDCHYALNNPVYFQELSGDQPEHLTFDPRRLDLGEYLYRPLHQFAKGQSAQSAIAPELDNTLRRCESCHSIEKSHNWLPYKERHTEAVACESCHTPRLYAPALESINWTAVNPDGTPLTSWRGIEGSVGDPNALITGYEPVLLPRQNSDGTAPLAPYNLITAWYWVYGDPQRPVPQRYLEAAWLEGDTYAPVVLDTFDADGDGRLSDAERLFDSEAKEALIAARLTEQGLKQVQIAGEIRPYSINHNTTHGDFATRDCGTCHGEASRLIQPITLAGSTPGGAMPTFINSGGTAVRGDILSSEDGSLSFQPALVSEDEALPSLYIFGHSSVYWVDWLGILMFVGVVLGILAHGSLRIYFARRQQPVHMPTERVYMYHVYERLWHWLQTAVILGLLFTGLIIHKPDKFGLFSFNYMVQIHNILALILLVNAGLSLFYHLASGEIRQYLPRPRGFIDQAVEQAVFYLRDIFQGKPHPFEKTPEQKLNPLQQATYFGLLNILLPLQIITGLLMFGAQQWPDIAARTGGLPFLAPFHTLVAWTLASFVVMHVYLTTTGHTPTAAIKGMMLGYDEVEVHPAPTD